MKSISSRSLAGNFTLVVALILLVPILLASCSNKQNQKDITGVKTAEAGQNMPVKTADAEKSTTAKAADTEKKTTLKTSEAGENTTGEKNLTGSGFVSPQAAAEAFVYAIVGKDENRIKEVISHSYWIKSLDAYQISNMNKFLANVDPSFIKYISVASTVKGFYKVILCYKTKELIGISIKEEKNRFYVENTFETIATPKDGSITPPSTMPDKISSSRPDDERIKQDLAGEPFYYKYSYKWIIEKSEIKEFKIISRDITDPDYEYIIADITFASSKSTIKGLLNITYTKSKNGWLFSRIKRVQDFASVSQAAKTQNYNFIIKPEDGNKYLYSMELNQKLLIEADNDFKIWQGGEKYTSYKGGRKHTIWVTIKGGLYVRVDRATKLSLVVE